MRRAVNEAGDVVLDQEVYGAWSREKAAEQSEWLFQRHPLARLIWAGNDLMAFGAMDAAESLGLKPGRDLLCEQRHSWPGFVLSFNRVILSSAKGAGSVELG